MPNPHPSPRSDSSDSAVPDTALFNQSAPAKAQARHDYDAQFAAKYNLPLNKKIQELRRAIAEYGFDGVNVVAKKYGLPLAAMLLMLQQAMGEEPAS